MGKWSDRAKQIEEGQPRANSANSAISPPIGTNDTNGTASPVRILKHWHSKLVALDPENPPDGFGAKDWWQLWLDACWLYETHADYAVRNGWTAQSLFGVNVENPPAGGMAQLLQSSRSVVFNGPRAVVRSYGVTFKRNSAWAEGCPLIWELGK